MWKEGVGVVEVWVDGDTPEVPLSRVSPRSFQYIELIY